MELHYNFSNDSLEIANSSNIPVLETWETYTLLIYTWLYCAIGLPANTVTIITLLKWKTRSPASMLQIYLAVTDNAALVAKLVEANLNAYSIITGWFACKFLYVPSVTLTTISNWTLVLICGERFIAVCCPLKRQQRISIKRCKITFASLSSCVLVCVWTVYFFSDGFYSQVYLFMLGQGLVMVIIPFFVITALTAAVIGLLHKYRKKRKNLFEISSVPQNNRILNNIAASKQTATVAARMENTLSLLMILAAFLYFFVYAPYNVMILIVLPIYGHEWNFTLHLTVLIFFILADSSHVLNCLLYFSLAKGFRSGVLKVLKL